MNSRTCLPFSIVILALMANGGLLSPAHAQGAVGGPTKPINHVGGATTHSNPVVPPPKGATNNAVPPTPTSTKKK